MPSDVIQWFPGHMAKTRRMIAENLKLVDIVFELRDARIPYSSQNPEIARLVAQKKRITLLSKASLADGAASEKWKRYFDGAGEECIYYDIKTGEGIDKIAPAARRICSEKLLRDEQKGISRPLCAMIVGIPNVGKSSLINRLAADKKAKVENRPGVTLNKQWVRTSIGIDLLDMPGVLWPKFDERRVGENLAMTGAVKDEITDLESLACTLCKRLTELYPVMFCERYKLDAEKIRSLEGWQIVEEVGRKRGFLASGGEINFERTSKMLIDEFRSGAIGRMTLELPEEKHA